MTIAAAQNVDDVVTSMSRSRRAPRALLRAVLMVATALTACSSGSTPASNSDLAVQDAAAICTGDLAPIAHGPTACGSITCPADKICMIFTPGIALPDGGNGYSYSCEDLPADCSCAAAGCGAQPSSPGCFHELCQGEPSCSFEGSTLTCYGI